MRRQINNRNNSKKDNISKWMPGGVPSALESLPGRYITRGLGGRCWDQKEKEYIDFICGYGALILGHCNPEINQAVAEQLNLGMMFPANASLHDELATTLKRIFPYADRSLFLKTGSEAVSAATRLSRAFTGKSIIIRCGYHGWHDSVISPYISWHRYESDSKPPRLVAGVDSIYFESLFIRWDGEDLEKLERLFQAHSSNVAALILDPVQLREPLDAHLRQICQLARKEGALVILDEAKTGFRVNLAGVQGLYNVQPDLTILSKGISNGFPLSIVTGRAEIMDMSIDAKIMGTYNNELLSIVAALNTISVLQRPTSIPWLWQIGQRLIEGINEILDRQGLSDVIQAVAYRWPCMPFIWFHQSSEKAQNLKPAFYRQLVKRGVLLLDNHMNFTCIAHTSHDVENALQVIEDAWVACIFGKSE